MGMVKTKSFELAVNAKGNPNASKLALLLPGRLDPKDYINFEKHAQYLAGKGFYAIAFDPPGTWDSPGGIELFTTTNYIKTVNELIEYFGNKPTLLLGHSRGGATAILASTNPNVTGIVLVLASYEAPSEPDSLENGVQIEYRDMPPGDKKTEEQKKFELPLEYFTDGQKYNPLEVLKACTKPKLLFSGTDDEYYTPEEVKEIYDSLLDPKKYHKLNTDHDYRYRPEVIEEVNRGLKRFLHTYFIKHEK